ncbi:hypothetical protein BCGT_0039 [Mycobacterium tuberculosis variant bovis BCG str. ATCC 35743]|nr:hypothetical protein BCGT_0039 [Mycobacterium tuberculosis variant bovis BCG str. ATCC 35743]KRT48509.1 hypothetical protein EI32_1020 [Mycobacterium tuberculosis]BAL64120.1 hypothetical protein ERDMAN_0303 [Mycobacterium tuberculosis str. Erdman = ATCC 35801]BAQ04131.1 hypothetical protein KURONO_0310 [Mycobacterium tuberculosis str. Kurono]KXN93905.1 hypothetical protein HX91_0242 [Mycobacterium tuberculosis]
MRAMSEHTSATWLIPPSSNSVLVLCGLIIVRLPLAPRDGGLAKL